MRGRANRWWFQGWSVLLILLASACSSPISDPPSGDSPRTGSGGADSGDGAENSTTASRAKPSGADVVLITIDTLRYDAVGHSNSGIVETPNMDALAAEGWVFERGYAHNVVTLPSHANILTGKLPFRHGIRDNAGFQLPKGEKTLAHAFRDAGYRTGAFISSFPLDARFGLNDGFDTYDDAYEGHGGAAFTVPQRPGEDTVQRAVDWWESQSGQPRFLWVHLFTPHFPYDPSPQYASAHASPYYAEAVEADAQIAPLIDLIKAATQQEGPAGIIAITSDHGESLGEHGEATHGLFAYEATLHVPYLLWAPDHLKPRRIREPVGHVDLAPTLLELAGLGALSGIDGRSLLTRSSDGVYFEALSGHLNRGWAPLYGQVEARFKAIDLPIPELYDLDADPAEAQNLHSSKPARWEQLVATIPSSARAEPDREEVDEETRARLESLGYVTGSSGGDREWGVADDPKRLINREDDLFQALGQYEAGDAEGAIKKLRQLITDHPRMTVAYGHLAFMYQDQGRAAEAIDVLNVAKASGAANESLRRKLALALLSIGKGEQAWNELAIDDESTDAETQSVLARIAIDQGWEARAETHLTRAAQIDPTFPSLMINRGILRLVQGRVPEAGELLKRGLAVDAYHAEGWNALGFVRSSDGDIAGAEDAWRRALQVDPNLDDAMFNLGLALGKRGQFAESRSLLERYRSRAVGENRTQVEQVLRELASLEARQAG